MKEHIIKIFSSKFWALLTTWLVINSILNIFDLLQSVNSIQGGLFVGLFGSVVLVSTNVVFSFFKRYQFFQSQPNAKLIHIKFIAQTSLYLIFAATITTIFEFLCQAFMKNIYSLGSYYIPLIAACCIPLSRYTGVPLKNSFKKNILLSLEACILFVITPLCVVFCKSSNALYIKQFEIAPFSGTLILFAFILYQSNRANQTLERDRAYCAAFPKIPGSGRLNFLSELLGL